MSLSIGFNGPRYEQRGRYNRASRCCCGDRYCPGCSGHPPFSDASVKSYIPNIGGWKTRDQLHKEEQEAAKEDFIKEDLERRKEKVQDLKIEIRNQKVVVAETTEGKKLQQMKNDLRKLESKVQNNKDDLSWRHSFSAKSKGKFF